MSIPPNTNIDVGAPFSQEAEEATLGSCLIDWSAFPQLRAFLKADDFFLLRHQYIWQALCHLDDNSEPIDLITVAERLENMGVLENIGGRAYLVSLLNNTGTSIYAEVYARLVQRTGIRRKAMVAADELKKGIQDETTKIDEVLTQHQAKMMDLQLEGDGMEFVTIADAVSQHMDRFELRRQNPNHVVGLPTKYSLFDHITQGLENGRLYVIGGVTGMGKSAFMMNIALRIAKQKRKVEKKNYRLSFLNTTESKETCHVAWFSYENMVDETTTRLVANMATIDTKRIKAATTDNESGETQRYFTEAGHLANLNLYITENAELNIMQLRAMCRKLRYAGQLDIVFADYLQIIPSGGNFQKRHEEIGFISGELKKMAKELAVPVVTAVQLNRDSFKTSRMPMLSDIRESGKIEQDSDGVILLHSEDYPWGGDWSEVTETDWDMKAHIAKSRGTDTGVCDFKFRRPYMQFVEIVPEPNDPFINSSDTPEQVKEKQAARPHYADDI